MIVDVRWSCILKSIYSASEGRSAGHFKQRSYPSMQPAAFKAANLIGGLSRRRFGRTLHQARHRTHPS
jgi:hypothetical protein